MMKLKLIKSCLSKLCCFFFFYRVLLRKVSGGKKKKVEPKVIWEAGNCLLFINCPVDCKRNLIAARNLTLCPEMCKSTAGPVWAGDQL